MIVKNTASDEIIDLIKNYGGNISDIKIIEDAIRDSFADRNSTLKLWQEYNGEVPIKSRTMEKYYMPNSKLAHPFRNVIVNTKVNMYLSNPVQYNYDKKQYDATEQVKIEETLDSLQSRNDVESLDYELGQYIGACGYAFRLLYYNENGELMMYNIAPWEAYVEMDVETMKTQYGLVFYKRPRIRTNSSEIIYRWYIEYYDKAEVSTYMETDEGGEYELQEKRLHGFNEVPLIKFKNTLSKSDFEFVRNLIDDYDLRSSDSSNDLSDTRNAVKVIKSNKKYDREQLEMFGKTRTIWIGTDDEFKFESPSLNPEYKEKHLERIKKDIYSLSATVDLSSSESIQNAESGYARTIRMYNMLNDVRGKERNFKKGLTEMFAVILPTLKDISLKLEDIYFVFIENIPTYFSVDDAVKAVSGDILSRRTIMEKIGIEDVNKEFEEIVNEKQNLGEVFTLDEIPELNESEPKVE